MSAIAELKRHPAKLRTLGYGSIATLLGLTLGNPYALAGGIGVIGFGVVQLVQHWGSGGRRENDCHVCGERTETGLVTCEACQDIVPEKAFVLECEWCEKRWYSDFKFFNVLRSMIHVHHNHQEEMRRDYS